MDENIEFLRQTAIDYDIDLETVRVIYNHNDERFYENLEIILEKRKNKGDELSPVNNPVTFYGL